MHRITFLTFAASFVIAGLASSESTSAATVAKWKGGDGRWEDTAQWEGAPPEVTLSAEINGASRVTVDGATAAAVRLDLGSNAHSDASLTVNGGTLLAQDFIRIAEEADSRGRLVVNGGRVCTTEVGIGGMNAGDVQGTACDAEMEVRGGLVVTKYLVMGYRHRSTARLRVVGSKAEGIVVLNSFDCAVANGAAGATCEMIFEIDAGGVTPIELRNPHDAIRLTRSGQDGKCLLRVKLTAAPPGGEIPLLRSLKPCVGTFHELPEGSLIRAEQGGATFEWRLTYHGGESKCDVVLADPQVVAANGKTAYRGSQPARVARVESSAIKAVWEQLFREIDRGTPPLETGTLAFPGAEGYGAHAKGGRGGKVLFVTNLNDAGPGSLREAIAAKGPRTVVFRVGGIIELQSPLQIREPFLTIAGQTAPGDGICLKGSRDTLMLLNTHDVILRALRVRTGYAGDKDADEGDAITAYRAQNFIIDHCSTSWGTDETLSCTDNCDRYTVQWCIIAEGLDYYGHSMGSILGGDRSTWHHNLYAHCGTRNPRFAGLCRCDFRNNVIYDWRNAAGYGDFRSVNYVNNYLKPGPSTKQKPPRFITGESYVLPRALQASGNVMEGWPDLSRDNRRGTAFDVETYAGEVHDAPPVETQSAEEAMGTVLAAAGARWPRRDAVDSRIVDDVRHNTGHVIRRESEVGGWPAYAGGEPPQDSDGDGIPDDWEKAHGLNSQDASDGNRVGSDGYTNLEQYLNSLMPGTGRYRSVSHSTVAKQAAALRSIPRL